MALTMQRGTRRQADAAKWTELFSKAVREGVEVRQTGSGLWIATSGSGTAGRATYLAHKTASAPATSTTATASIGRCWPGCWAC